MAHRGGGGGPAHGLQPVGEVQVGVPQVLQVAMFGAQLRKEKGMIKGVKA